MCPIQCQSQGIRGEEEKKVGDYGLGAILDSHFLRFPCQHANQRKGKNKFKNTLNLIFKEKQISINVEQEGLPP